MYLLNINFDRESIQRPGWSIGFWNLETGFGNFGSASGQNPHRTKLKNISFGEVAQNHRTPTVVKKLWEPGEQSTCTILKAAPTITWFVKYLVL